MPDIFISPEEKPKRHHEMPAKPQVRKIPVVSTPVAEKDASKPMFALSSFALNPSGVYFVNQGENEEIVLFLRKHFITNVPWIVAALLLFLLPVFVLPLLSSLVTTIGLSANYTLILLLFYYIAVFGGVVLASFINWYFNVYIVTNERVVDVDFINILYREISATRLNLIQDVTVKTGGVIRAIFNYGDLFIQTAGNEANFDFHAVPHAQDVAREIERLMEQARKTEGRGEFEEALER